MMKNLCWIKLSNLTPTSLSKQFESNWIIVKLIKEDMKKYIRRKSVQPSSTST